MLCSCIQAKGFPPDICPAEVARAVFTKTGATIDKIAPSTSADSRSPGWLLYLPSHDDQINCLHHHRTFTVALNDESYLVKLDLPHMSLNASELDWIVINKGEDKMDSVDSEALFGSGGAGSADPNSNRTDSGQPIAGSFQGYHQHHPFPGQMGSPYLVGQGYAGQYPQPMDQEHYPSQPQGYPQHREHGYPQSPHDGLYQQGHRYSHGSDPDFQGHGANYPTARRGKEYPNNSPFPQHLMGRGRGLQFDFYNQQQLGQHFHQRSPANPEGEARAESLPQAMGDLNLKQDPFPHCDSFENQPAEFYGDAIGSPERDDYQSDFVVLEDTRPQESPQHHHHFHLQVTDLPDAITTKELVAFFEDRKESGGGPVTDVNHNQSTRSAAIYFFESDTIERIMKKRPLLLKNKKITVKPVSAEQQEAKTEVKTVEIRGLTTEKDTEMSILYFENPRKGGGDIENSDWDDKEKILYITFEEPEVAKSVASKGHKVLGNVLEVMLYTPPVEVEPEEMEPSCTVEVRGFDPTKEADLYEMYFSNPKKGGNDIADLRFSADKSVMYITFESPEVADRVASLPHKVGGQHLEVRIAPIEDPTELSWSKA